MKKIITIGLLIVLIALTALAGCSAPTAQPSDGGAEVINPLKEYQSVEELEEATGISMKLPHSAELVRVQSIDEKMNEVVFTVADGSEFTYRKAKSDMADTNGKDDISGNYAEWKDTHEATTPGGIKVTIKTGNPENESSGIAVWNDGEFKYVVMSDKNYDEDMLLAAVDAVK